MNVASMYINEDFVLCKNLKGNTAFSKKKIRKGKQKKEKNFYIGSPFDHQYKVISRVKRFGICIEKIWNLYVQMDSATLDKLQFIRRIDILDRDTELIMLTSLYVYLIDQLSWGRFSPSETIYESNTIIDRINSRYNVANEFCKPSSSKEQTIARMVDCFTYALISIVGSNNLHDWR